MKKIILLFIGLILGLTLNAQSVAYKAAMKPYLGEWVQHKSGVTMHLKIEKSGSKVTLKYKAVNTEDGSPKTYYSSFKNVKWTGNGFKCTKTTDDGYIIVETFTKIDSNTINGRFQSFSKANGKLIPRLDEDLGDFHNW